MNALRQTWASLFLTRRFFVFAGVSVVALLSSHFVPLLFFPARLSVWMLGGLAIVDLWALYRPNEPMSGGRTLPERLSNGDENVIEAYVVNRYGFVVRLEIIDELPEQLQIRDGRERRHVAPGETLRIDYRVRPVRRGLYAFGRLYAFASTPLGLIQRRHVLAEPDAAPVYPSFLQLRRFELLAASNRLHEAGVKKVRRIGQAMEFEQIREYVAGDDPRRVNWRATARRGDLMVNQYQDERAQPLYCLVDTGRVMQMPFEGMTLLDYSINASLVLSSVAINRHDRAGLLTFSHELSAFVRAEKGVRQLGVLMERLYAITTDFKESDFESLYIHVRRHVQQRSLLLLFTNFESMTALARQLPYLRALNRAHLLVVVFFENTELRAVRRQPPAGTEAIYIRTMAEQFALEKEEIVRELGRYGIQAILTTPQRLSVDTLNKYLELKARGLF